MIVLCFVVLGGYYSVIDPIFEASDEYIHYPYIKQLADGRGLPVPSPDPTVNLAHQEATQPPLYYALGALATFWIDTGDASHVYALNPYAQMGRPDSRDNKNIVVHSPAEAFPYRGVALAVHVVRWLSVLMGALTVILTYLSAREVLPGRPDIALGAALVNALVPGFLFIAASVNNDNLVTMLSSLGLYLLLRLVRRQSSRDISAAGPSLGSLALLGVVAGLAALSKLGGLALLGLVGLVLLWLAVRRRSLRSLVVWGLTTFVPAVLVAGWWYARNWLLYGDPTLLTQHLAIVVGRPTPVTLLDVLFGENQGLRWSFWGVFGGFNVAADPLVYRLYDLLTLLALLGMAVGLVRWLVVRSGGPTTAEPKAALPAWAPAAIAAGWVVLLYASLVRWSLLTMASQGRLMFPAISALCLALVFGWRCLLSRLSPRLFLAGLAAPLLVLAVLLPYRYIRPAYAAPPVLPAGSIESTLGGDTINVSFDDRMMLVAARLSDERLVPGQTVALDLYWRALAPMDRDYSIYIQLYDGAGQVVAREDTYPGGGAYATSQLRSGDELHDRYLLEVSREAQPGDGHLDVGLYEYPSLARLQPYDGAHRALPSPNVGSFEVYAAKPAPSSPRVAMNRSFADGIALDGYSLDLSSARPGGAISGGLYWRATGRPSRDYTVFVHLARHDAPPVAQADGQPQGGGYPTSLWRPGDEVYHPFKIALGSDMPAGEYDLLVGLYAQPTGSRLAVERGVVERVVGVLRRAIGRGMETETTVRLGSERVGGN